MMAQLVADDRMSKTLNDGELKGITMMSADEMEDRVNELTNVAQSVSPTNADVAMKSIVMKKYQTVAYGDGDDGGKEEEEYDGDSDHSDHSDSLSATEKAQIAMRKKEQESQQELRDEKAAMEEALRANSLPIKLTISGSNSRHKPQGSGLIKDLDMAELQMSDDFVIQQKKEMQEQMAHLLQRESTPKTTPLPATESAGFPSIDIIDEQQQSEVAQTKEAPSK